MWLAAASAAATLWKVGWQYVNHHREVPTADWGWPILSPHVHMILTPSVMHTSATFDEEEPIYVVGDIHGCYEEFKELLDRLPENAQVILTGDIINKGPDSLACLRLAMERDCLAVCGNHELICLLYRHMRQLDPSAMPDYAWLDDMTEEEAEFLRELPYTISLPQHNSMVVHAGMVPEVPLHEQNPFHLLLMRNARKAVGLEALLKEWLGLPLWEAMEHLETHDDSKWWAETWHGPEHVFYGHDARRKLRLREHSSGLDTGCLYGHSLTAMCVQTRDLISIPAKRAHVDPAATKKNKTKKNETSSSSSSSS